MLLSEFVQCEGAVKASILTQLGRNDLEGTGICSYQQLLLACNGQSMLPKEAAQLHLNCPAPSHDGIVLDGAPHNHNGIMKGALRLLNKLFRSSP